MNVKVKSDQAGAGLLKGGVLTICNTGALATGGSQLLQVQHCECFFLSFLWKGGHGTALGMVRSALEEGTSLRLYVNSFFFVCMSILCSGHFFVLVISLFFVLVISVAKMIH